MKKIKNINEILKLHEMWLNHKEGGVKADLSYADLRKVNLSGVNLSKADLSKAYLSDVDLSDTDLLYTDLSGANLRNADLTCANLTSANLKKANLTKAVLSCANLKKANLTKAVLSCANLTEANLTEANLTKANLTEAVLSGANLSNANLSNANLSNIFLLDVNLTDAVLSGANLYNMRYRYNHKTAFFALQCPEKGSFIGFKKAYLKSNSEPVIVEIMITEDAKRSSATTRKCRCSKAKVLSITSIDGDKEYLEAVSDYNKNFYYKVGEIIEVENFNENRWEECSEGIHFFISREEAINY